jgi:hypothetical protein
MEDLKRIAECERGLSLTLSKGEGKREREGKNVFKVFNVDSLEYYKLVLEG